MKKQYRKGADIQLSRNFHLSEFDCKCKYPDCQWTIIDTEHVAMLQSKRDKLKKSINLNCGYRCTKHNKDVGGATSSRHPIGDATDITIDGMTPDQVADEFENCNGLGRYDTFTHCDSREIMPGKGKSRWDFRGGKGGKA